MSCFSVSNNILLYVELLFYVVDEQNFFTVSKNLMIFSPNSHIINFLRWYNTLLMPLYRLLAQVQSDISSKYLIKNRDSSEPHISKKCLDASNYCCFRGSASILGTHFALPSHADNIQNRVEYLPILIFRFLQRCQMWPQFPILGGDSLQSLPCHV